MWFFKLRKKYITFENTEKSEEPYLVDLPAQFPTLRLSWVQMELSPLPLGATPGPSFHLAAWAGQGRAAQGGAELCSSVGC